jgi:hypothetical protein
MRRLQMGILVSVVAIAGLLLFASRSGRAQGPTPPGIPPGAVASHLVGRFVINADGTDEMYGYYPFIEGVPGPFFAGDPSEATAYLTFRTSTSMPQIIPNGDIYHIFLTPPAGGANTVNVYLNSNPAGDFTNPDTFSSGQLIATFQSHTGMITAIPNTVGTGMTTASLISSSDFSFNGQTFNFNALGGGVTLVLTPTGMPISGSLTNLPLVVPFGATGLAVGSFPSN